MLHKPAIHFGTSGWRGIIAEDFTFDTVRLAVAAVAAYVRSQNRKHPRLIVGYDTRFLSEDFARAAVDVLTGSGITSCLCTEPTPTPTIASEILRRKTDGGINFTASHNPAAYNGLKFSTPDGAPALPEVTRHIEALVVQLARRKRPARARGRAAEEVIDPRPAYLEMLAHKVKLDEIRRAGLKIVFDPLYGTGRGYVDGLLREHGVNVWTVHDYRDVLFGGHAPEPDEENLADAREALRDQEAQVVLATDGDADRFGILDRDGSLVSPNHVLALLLDYLVESRGWTGGAARSVATTHLIDAVARFHHLPVHETPVGFKYIGELIKADKIIIGGEESAGLSIQGHVPEKDGILACLLVAEMIASRGASLREQLERLFAKVGAYYPVRLNLRLEPETERRLLEQLKTDPSRFNGKKVAEIKRVDGLKLILEDGSWVLLRKSGTEPVVRCYCEARSPGELDALVESAKRFIFG
ncbi:MAG: phosphoglucomutase/phosphomannomutase family protein [Acidobacteria bacterium]|nr:phosphoglucomutase/phosphomannomutase family protein [Acidobacteriota bacterium]